MPILIRASASNQAQRLLKDVERAFKKFTPNVDVLFYREWGNNSETFLIVEITNKFRKPAKATEANALNKILRTHRCYLCNVVAQPPRTTELWYTIPVEIHESLEEGDYETD